MNLGAGQRTDAADDGERRLINAAWAQFERIGSRGVIAPSVTTQSFQVPGYRLLGEIHRGGQGVVYQAIQESTQRKLAIKVLKEGPFADRVELARFEREIDVLSRLDHPHIVAIHDRGLTAGHAYYVMDYVAGRSIDAYVAGADLSIEDILDLFAKICDAVNVAHLRGVIHRDLKPGNIRVDENGDPRILDFGLAKLAQEAAEASSAQGMTLTGQFVGSLPWASPEQAGGRSELIDVRSDVYSLGIILYQLLTRRFPYPVIGKLSDVVRHITETSPARPSAVRHGLDHDIELILLKCLAKEPERRYQSAGELARDVRHYLAHEPVSATSPSAGYRLRKFVRRNRGPVVAGAIVACALLIGAGISLAFGLSEAQQRAAADESKTRAEKAEEETEARANELEKVAKFQQEQLAGIDAEIMGGRLRAGLLESVRAAAERIGLSPDECDARIEELDGLIAGSDFTGLALDALDDNFFQPALAAIDEQFADQPLVQARLMQALAATLHELGLYDAASVPQTQALAIRRRVQGDNHPDTITAINNVGFLLLAQGNLTQAETYIREALERSRTALGEDHPHTLDAMDYMGLLLQAQGKLNEAEPYYIAALEKRRETLGDEHPDTLGSMNNMGFLYQAQGRLAEAEPYFREALEKLRRVRGNEHLDTLTAINNMGGLYYAQGNLLEAERYLREAMDVSRRVLGDEHHDTLRAIDNVAVVLRYQGRLAEAEVYVREALTKHRHVLGDEHPDTIVAIGNMGVLLQVQGSLAEAEPYLREAEDASRRVLGDEHPVTLRAVTNLGGLLLDQGNLAEAESYLREAVDERRRILGDEHPDTLLSVGQLSRLLMAQDKPDEAVELLAATEPAARAVFTDGNAARLGCFITALGRARVATGEFDAANANLSEAHTILNGSRGAVERDQRAVLTGLVELYDAWNTAEPDKGYDNQANQWRAELSEMSASTQSATP